MGLLGLSRLGYLLWQLAAWRAAWRLHREVGFDCGHHCSYGIYWMPSFLALMPFPYVWGPVGGAEAMPPSFWRVLPPRGKVYETVRLAAQRVGELNPWLRATARRAALTLAATPATEARLRRIGCRRVRQIPQLYLTTEDIAALEAIPLRERRPFRVITTATLIHWKGCDLALRAFARLSDALPESEHWIVGDGPDRARLERLAWKLGIRSQVKFWGLVERDAWLRLLEGVDVFLFSSLHDSGGFVCLEAMAAGRPVVCLQLGGPAITVDAQSGIRVPARHPRQAAAELGDALIRLAENPDERLRLGEGAKRRVRMEFDFDRRTEWISELYARAFDPLPSRRMTGPLAVGRSQRSG